MKVRKLLVATLLFALLGSLQAQPVTIAQPDIYIALSTLKGKRVTVRLRSGGELTGEVRDITAKVVVLGVLQGREFFDAIVALDAIDVVFVRNKQ